MVRNIEFHISLSPARLDQYLARGWYRIGPFIFTTDQLTHPDGNFRVFWLRYPIKDFHLSKKQERLLRSFSRFEISIKPLELTEELEELYAEYRSHLDFMTSETLYRLLYDELHPSFVPPSLFNSQLIEVRDGDKLVAAGVFDLGQKSSAGIVNFYDPAYRKFSPGKCLMLLKMEYSRQLGLDYYYPGYIALDYTKFDYKLFAGEHLAQVFEPVSQTWLSYSKEIVEKLRDILPSSAGLKENADFVE